jgi:hypothetical protein
MKLYRTFAAILTAAALVAGPMSPALASDADVVRRSGDCSGRSNWELKGKHDDGRLEIEYEVDTPRVGREWRVRLTDNGNVIFRGTRTTNAASGSFTVDIRRPNLSGPDVIRGRAVDTVNGEICRGRITL